MSKLFSLFDDSMATSDSYSVMPSKNIDDLSESTNDNELVVQRLSRLSDVTLKVDYSDFKNFVFFNSALDYFNITGEKILNEYPYDGTSEQIDAFVAGLDDYQRYVLSTWPAYAGYLTLNSSISSSYISIGDSSVYSGNVANGLLNIGTGSFTIEMWLSMPSSSFTGTMGIVEKSSGSCSYSVFVSSSDVYFLVTSGSTSCSLSSSISRDVPTFMSFVFDRDASLVSIATGTNTSFPSFVVSSSLPTFGNISAGTTSFVIGSGSVSGQIAFMSASIDDVRIWNVARTVAMMSEDFNTKVYAQDGLVGLWRFNESGSMSTDERFVVVDCSGHSLNGMIVDYFDAVRKTGSLMSYDSQDPMMTYSSPEVTQIVYVQQMSASAYDNDNENMITKLLPEQFFLLEELNFRW